MLKKLGLGIAALLLASCLFVGCGGGGDGGDGDVPRELKTVFELSTNEAFQAYAVGTALNDNNIGQEVTIPMLTAGSDVVVIAGTTKGLKVTVTSTWGGGIDLVHQPKGESSGTKGAFNFYEGDKIYIKGKLITKAGGLNTLIADSGAGGMPRILGEPLTSEVDEEFEYEYELTADDVTAIAASNSGYSPCIRIKAGQANSGQGSVFEIYEILVEGLRPSGFIAVTDITGVPSTGYVGEEITLSPTVTPDTATNTSIDWSIKSSNPADIAEIDGNKITASAAGTVVITATIENGKTSTEDYTKDFTIAFTNRPLITAVIKLFEEDIDVDLISLGGAEITATENGFEYETTNWQKEMVKFSVDLGDGKTFADVGSVKASVTITGSDGGHKDTALVVGLDLEGANYTNNVPEKLSATVGTGTANGVTANLTYDLIPAKIAAIIDEQVLDFMIYVHVPSGQTVKIENIEIIEREYTGLCATCGCDLTSCDGCNEITGCDGFCEDCDECGIFEQDPGVIFDLANWLDDNEGDYMDGDGNLTAPFEKAGSPTITFSTDGIEISDRENTWDSLDIYLFGVNKAAEIVPSAYKYKITVAGESEENVIIQEPGGSYTTFATGEPDEENLFEMSFELAADFDVEKIRITPNAATPESFKITSIIIENIGEWD